MHAMARHDRSRLAMFLALILLGFAAVIGLGAGTALVGNLWAGQWRSLVPAAIAGGVVWSLGWLGLVLWSGRMIPRWFIGAFFGSLLGLVVVAALLDKGSWMETIGAIGLVIPMALQVMPILRDYPAAPPAKPAKPAPLDDLA